MSGNGCGYNGVNYVGYLGFGDGGLGGSLPPADLAIPRLLRLEINGAPVIEQSHEYVIRIVKTDAQNR